MGESKASPKGGGRQVQTSRRKPPQQPEPPFAAQHLRRPGLESRLEPEPRWRATSYRAAGKLEGKVALVTGGDSGIGRALAYLFAREGADVAVVHLPSEASDARVLAEAVEETGREALLVAGDVRDAAFCRDAVQRTVEAFGRLDILVNNAAYQNHTGSLEDLGPEQWRRTFATNIDGYYHMARAALAHLPDGGAIINTGSVVGLRGSGELLDYAATKGAIHAFTKSLAQNLLKRRIRVNCVAPGPVWTPLNPADIEAKDVATFGADTPYGRPAQPEEVAPAFVFFASQADSGYITGEVLSVTGGEIQAA